MGVAAAGGADDAEMLVCLMLALALTPLFVTVLMRLPLLLPSIGGSRLLHRVQEPELCGSQGACQRKWPRW